MTFHTAPQITKTLTYCTILDKVIHTHRQSPHSDKVISLSKWLKSMNTLVEHLHARRPSKGKITESDYADTIWSLFMCGIPETLDLVQGISQRDLHPPSLTFEEILERVQFHTIATELTTGYYRRYVIFTALLNA